MNKSHTAELGRVFTRAAIAVLLLSLVASTTPLSASSAQSGLEAIVISEIFYNPDGADEGAEFVELTNRSNQVVDVSSWAFTNGIDHVIADGTSLGAQQSLVIARESAAFRVTFGFDPDGDFAGALSNGGETLTLRDPADGIADEVTWADLPPWPASADGDGDSLQLIDLGADNAAAESWGVGQPTPRATNNVRLDVTANVGRGWYQGDQTVVLTPSIPGAAITYTTGSGSLSQTYSDPITVNDNGGIRVIRAQARLGNLRSPVVAMTYVFKPDRGVPVVSTWPNPVAVAPGKDESTISFEFIPPPSTRLVSAAGYAGLAASEGGVDAGQSDKVFFRGDYGNGTLTGDLFGDFSYGIEPTTKFDQLFLRDEHLDNTHLRQIIAHDALLELGQLSPHGRFVEYYTSGSDRGVRHLQERPEGGFMESYTDIDKDEWRAWSRNEGGLGRGTMGAPYTSWAEANQILNLESLIDFSLVQWQANVEDYRSVKNFRTAGPVQASLGDGGDYRFHFFNWDMDIGYNRNFYGRGAPDLWAWADFVSPDYVMHSIDHFDEFALLASDRIACAFYGGGPLTGTAFRTRLDARRDELVRAGGANASTFVSQLENWIDARNAWLLNRFRRSQHTRNVYNTQRADAAPYKPPSAFVGPLLAETNPVTVTIQGNRLTLSNAQGGVLYYRLDGGDPRTPNGQIAAGAIAYTGPVDLPAGRHGIIARAFSASEADVRDRWTPACSDPQIVDIAGRSESLVINELHYNPLPIGNPADPGHVDGDRFEFVEIYNPGQAAVGVGGYRFDLGINYEFPLGAAIAPGDFIVLASDALRFSQRFGAAPFGDYDGNLSDGGETITLVDSTSQVIDSVTFDDALPWDPAADSTGPSLSLIEPGLDNSQSSAWRASSADDGSPFEANVTLERGDVDGSFDLTAADVQALLDYNVGLQPEPFFAGVADVNQDGQIGLLDALILAQTTPG